MQQIWLRRANGLLRPINITVFPQISVSDGLQLIGVIQKVKKFEIFEKRFPSQSVFCILADVNLKITQVSENCVSVLKFPANIDLLDIFLHQLILDLPSSFENVSEFDCRINLDVLKGHMSFRGGRRESIRGLNQIGIRA